MSYKGKLVTPISSYIQTCSCLCQATLSNLNSYPVTIHLRLATNNSFSLVFLIPHLFLTPVVNFSSTDELRDLVSFFC